MRLVYSALIQLHPPEFRRDFGGQMLCIFDEMSLAGARTFSLCADAAISLARQWLLRSNLWIPCIALIVSCALFDVFPLWRPRIRPWMIHSTDVVPTDANELLVITLLSLGTISFILAATVAWSRAVHTRRSNTCHSNYARSRNATAAFPRLRT